MHDGDGEYPSVRRILFGQNDHVWNLYCGGKLILWHLFHALFVVMGVIALAIAVPVLLLYRGLKYALLRAGGWLADRLGPRTERVAERSSETLSVAGESAKSRPVTRRIYGECPVSIKQDPRWFQRLSGFGTTIMEWAEPPETVWVCRNCGDVRDRDYTPTRCWDCQDPDFEKVVKSETERTTD